MLSFMEYLRHKDRLKLEMGAAGAAAAPQGPKGPPTPEEKMADQRVTSAVKNTVRATGTVPGKADPKKVMDNLPNNMPPEDMGRALNILAGQ